MRLREALSNAWDHIQKNLFPFLREEIGPLTPLHERLVVVLDFASIESFVKTWDGLPGRPQDDRDALARAFVAKAVMNLPTTSALLERLSVDATLRRLCGWTGAGAVPSESTFSRAFAELAQGAPPSRLHEALIARTHEDRLVGHISRDSTAIEAREKPAPKAAKEPKVTQAPKAVEAPKRKRGRPRKGEEAPPKEPKRLDRQKDMTLPEMLADLPKDCAVGAKRNAKGHLETWIGYKLHVDTADGDIPVSCILTSASLHDPPDLIRGQAAIPLATMTSTRVINLYDLMDSAYDAPQIADNSRELGHVPIIDRNPRRGGKEEAQAEERARRCAGVAIAEDIRYRERSAAERVNSALKDSYGGRSVRVRGNAKVTCHLMFGVLALAAEQLTRLVT
jgi:hypothetical protein